MAACQDQGVLLGSGIVPDMAMPKDSGKARFQMAVATHARQAKARRLAPCASVSGERMVWR